MQQVETDMHILLNSDRLRQIQQEYFPEEKKQVTEYTEEKDFIFGQYMCSVFALNFEEKPKKIRKILNIKKYCPEDNKMSKAAIKAQQSIEFRKRALERDRVEPDIKQIQDSIGSKRVKKQQGTFNIKRIQNQEVYSKSKRNSIEPRQSHKSKGSGPPYYPHVVPFKEIVSKQALLQAEKARQLSNKKERGSSNKNNLKFAQQNDRKADNSKKKKKKSHLMDTILRDSTEKIQKRNSQSKTKPKIQRKSDQKDEKRYLIKVGEQNRQVSDRLAGKKAPKKENMNGGIEEDSNTRPVEDQILLKQEEIKRMRQEIERQKQASQRIFMEKQKEIQRKEELMMQSINKYASNASQVKIVIPEKNAQLTTTKQLPINKERLLQNTSPKERPLKTQPEQQLELKNPPTTPKQKLSKQKIKLQNISKESNLGQQDWRKQLRKITGYNPSQSKYRNRDRQQIIQSGFHRIFKQEAQSRQQGQRQQVQVLNQQRQLKLRKRQRRSPSIDY